MNQQRTLKNSALAYLLLSSMVAQVAYGQRSAGGSGKPHRPPPQAFEACADLAVGDSCEMTGRRGETLQGSCIVPREEEDVLVCAPEGAPGRERQPGEDE